MLCRRSGEDITFTSRNGKNWTDKLQPLVRAISQLGTAEFIIDGEVVTDDNGEEYREELTSGLYGLFLDGESGENPAPDPPDPPWPGPWPPWPPLSNENTFYGTNAGANTVVVWASSWSGVPTVPSVIVRVYTRPLGPPGPL